MISAADTLGLPRVSSTIDDFVLYLPKLLGALLVVIIGLSAAHLVRTAVETAAQGMDLDYGRALGTVIHMIMVIVIISLAIGQLEIETDLLNQVVSIFLLAIAAAVRRCHSESDTSYFQQHRCRTVCERSIPTRRQDFNW